MAELRKKKPVTQTETDRSAEYAGMAGMSALDQAALKAAGNAWNKANQAGDRAGMDAAHGQADRIRGKYGYSGGAAGDQYLPTGSPGAFSYQQAPSYASKYDGAISALMQRLLGREEFSYDHTQDPLYQQMEAQYTKGAQRAMDDTLGKVAARTGGIASSYAASAAQGAYNEHMEGLASQIPALQQLAYAMHMDKQEGKRADLNLLLGLEELDYGRHLDALGQFNNDRSFAYGMSRDALNDRRYDEEQAYGRAADKAALLGAAGDFSGYQALGFSPAEIAALTAASRREQTAGSTRSAGSKSASGAAPAGDIYGQMYSGGIRTTGDAYAYLLGQGQAAGRVLHRTGGGRQFGDQGAGDGLGTGGTRPGFRAEAGLWAHQRRLSGRADPQRRGGGVSGGRGH